jgi:hypothetical protein
VFMTVAAMVILPMRRRWEEPTADVTDSAI